MVSLLKSQSTRFYFSHKLPFSIYCSWKRRANLCIFLVPVGNRGEACFENQRYFQPSGPLVNSEFYPGWINNWGIPFQHRDADTVAKNLDSLLSMNVSVNVYMFHGGTNFGFMNGIVFSGFFHFLITSASIGKPSRVMLFKSHTNATVVL